jgi:hypothetical protein
MDNKRTDERRVISAEMHFLRRTAGYTHWDHKRNEDILTELQMSQITEFIYQYRKNWKEHVDRISKMILKYQPKGKRNLGRKEKMEGFSFVTPVTGLSRPNTGKEDDDESHNSPCLFCFSLSPNF